MTVSLALVRRDVSTPSEPLFWYLGQKRAIRFTPSDPFPWVFIVSISKTDPWLTTD